MLVPYGNLVFITLNSPNCTAEVDGYEVKLVGDQLTIDTRLVDICPREIKINAATKLMQNFIHYIYIYIFLCVLLYD